MDVPGLCLGANTFDWTSDRDTSCEVLAGAQPTLSAQDAEALTAVSFDMEN